MNQKSLKLLMGGIMLMGLAAHGNALESDRHQPLKIVADTALIDEKDGTAVYTGNVVLTQGTLKIAADNISITTAEGKVDKVMANGDPALFSQVPEPNQAEVIAKAKSIDYLVREQTLMLKRKASIVQGENIFRGEEILYEIQSQRLQALGQTADPKPGDIKGRVEMILPAAAEPLPENKPPQ
jgi:lipopolysaccharide export system protein LptA